MKKKRLLYFYVSNSSFVRKDKALLSSKYDFKGFDFEIKYKGLIFLKFFSQLIFLLTYGSKANVIVCQFSGYHSFLPAFFGKLTGKRTFVIAGGNDTVSFPSLRYGNFSKRFLGLFTVWSYRLAHHILPKHETLWKTEYTYAPEGLGPQGITAFVKKLSVPHTVIRNGYNGKEFFKNEEKQARTFLTVTGAMHYSFQKYLKGIDLILQVASYFPDCIFTIVGVEAEITFPNKPSNVKLLKKVPHDELIHLYSRHTYYLQLSLAEGFPNALCEAMLCECVPIGSNVFSIPEIISVTGFLLMKKDVQYLKTVLDYALKSDTQSLGKKARNRILENYTIERRSDELFAALDL